MSVGSPAATDIPGIFDLIIGQVGGSLNGYMLAAPIAPNLPFRTQRARYGYTPTFVTRQNVSGDYGDNQQDFWLTASMRDWSLGEDQRYYRSTDADRARQYWIGHRIDVSIPGQVTLAHDMLAVTFGQSVDAICAWPAGGTIFAVGSTNLYEVTAAGVVTDRGAHGVGGLPTALALDGSFLYLSGPAGSKVRKYDLNAHTFADFSAQVADDLVYLNNTLYGCLNNVLYTYDTSGVATASFTFKTATGAALAGKMKLLAVGGKVDILRNSGTTNGSELWEYDGVGVAKLAEYPGNFAAKDFCVQSGIIFIIGQEAKGNGVRAAIWYYANGTIGRAWAHPLFNTSTVWFGYTITPFGNGLIFSEPKDHRFRFYDLQTGGTSTVGNVSNSATASYLATSDTFSLYTQHGTTGYILFDPANVPSQGFVETSLVDFESSLTKLFRGVIVDFVPATDGDGGSVDIWYTIDKTGFESGSFNVLQTGATSGTEYQFGTAVTGRGISIHLLINKGTSTLGPTVKRIYVRAAPKLNTFRSGEYVIDCTGIAGKTPVQLHNGMSHPLSGQKMVDNLRTDAISGNLLSISDRLGSFTGIVELENMEVIELRPKEFFVRFSVRGV